MVTMFTNTVSREDESGQTLRLMTTASTPATPGPSTPTAIRTIPLSQLKVVDDEEEGIVPPARPSSTPFPQQELLEGDIQCVPRANDLDSKIASNGLNRRYMTDQSIDLDIPDPTKNPIHGSKYSPLCNLPIEIHECILDYLFGFR